MPFRVFRTLFPGSMMAEVNATINKSIIFKTYNQSNVQHLSRCTLKIRHNAKCGQCRFFVVPGDSPTLLGMPDIELLSIMIYV